MLFSFYFIEFSKAYHRTTQVSRFCIPVSPLSILFLEFLNNDFFFSIYLVKNLQSIFGCTILLWFKLIVNNSIIKLSVSKNIFLMIFADKFYWFTIFNVQAYKIHLDSMPIASFLKRVPLSVTQNFFQRMLNEFTFGLMLCRKLKRHNKHL